MSERPDTGRLTVEVITIFPDYLTPLRQSLLGKAIDRGLVTVRVHDLRSFTDDAHRTVDDEPYGGGPGMVMLAEPWGRALDAIVPAPPKPAPTLIVPTPAGRPFTQAVAEELRLDASGHGDLYARAKVILPTQLSDDAVEAGRRFFDLVDQPDPR